MTNKVLCLEKWHGAVPFSAHGVTLLGYVGYAQIAKIKGAKVIAVARGAAKCEVLRGLGADLVVDSSSNVPLRSAIKKVAPGGELISPWQTCMLCPGLTCSKVHGKA